MTALGCFLIFSFGLSLMFIGFCRAGKPLHDASDRHIHGDVPHVPTIDVPAFHGEGDTRE